MNTPPASSAAPPTSWDSSSLNNPHLVADKAGRVRAMFSAIARSYDLNNHLHSLWIDHYWRRAAVRMAGVKPTDVVADIACGTGDLSLAFLKAGPKRVMGMDFCHAMLQGACGKMPGGTTAARLSFQEADALRLPLAHESVDIASIAFGIRNVADWQGCLREFHRIVRPGGRVIILEFSLPSHAVPRALYNFYFRRMIPWTATLISGDRTGAYRYLPRSVSTFITPEQMTSGMEQAGFSQVAARALTLGISVCYRGVRGG
ncbi:MAG: bifunctional demethylmenaquinone methyltransferase/2-methoxy-6-polyprenyl-1,4-benzoquinol methylase UbiE [Phycisphaerae bacterium]|nr:bifunctional demethylmenaquinone methyltransferase/2-methoxy-6-polyprenyl-1,4-benzoquinol methylase UbiE [Phycisphaerae bacterium]